MLLFANLKAGLAGWHENPIRMIAQLIVSFVVGQGVFWRFGYDQLGVAMNPKREFGAGVELADQIDKRLPQGPLTAWILKLIEILADFGKMPLEGTAYARHGLTPDVVAAAVTQPLWSAIEGVEKTVGAALHPERVNTPEQRRLSIGCIYGSLFRYVLALFVIMTGKYLNRFLTDPIEKLLRFAVKR